MKVESVKNAIRAGSMTPNKGRSKFGLGPVEGSDSPAKATVICSGLGGNRGNARLIAAAPDLLAALEQCADLLWQYGGDQSSDDGWKTEELREAYLNARTAIAKATADHEP